MPGGFCAAHSCTEWQAPRSDPALGKRSSFVVERPRLADPAVSRNTLRLGKVEAREWCRRDRQPCGSERHWRIVRRCRAATHLLLPGNPARRVWCVVQQRGGGDAAVQLGSHLTMQLVRELYRPMRESCLSEGGNNNISTAWDAVPPTRS
jgi:hypothetical protein